MTVLRVVKIIIRIISVFSQVFSFVKINYNYGITKLFVFPPTSTTEAVARFSRNVL
jgi:hypothetical protein